MISALKEKCQMPEGHITEKSEPVGRLEVQELTLELKSEGVGIQLCNMGREASQVKEVACVKALG